MNQTIEFSDVGAKEVISDLKQIAALLITINFYKNSASGMSFGLTRGLGGGGNGLGGGSGHGGGHGGGHGEGLLGGAMAHEMYGSGGSGGSSNEILMRQMKTLYGIHKYQTNPYYDIPGNMQLGPTISDFFERVFANSISRRMANTGYEFWTQKFMPFTPFYHAYARNMRQREGHFALPGTGTDFWSKNIGLVGKITGGAIYGQLHRASMNALRGFLPAYVAYRVGRAAVHGVEVSTKMMDRGYEQPGERERKDLAYRLGQRAGEGPEGWGRYGSFAADLNMVGWSGQISAMKIDRRIASIAMLPFKAVRGAAWWLGELWGIDHTPDPTTFMFNDKWDSGKFDTIAVEQMKRSHEFGQSSYRVSKAIEAAYYFETQRGGVPGHYRVDATTLQINTNLYMSPYQKRIYERTVSGG